MNLLYHVSLCMTICCVTGDGCHFRVKNVSFVKLCRETRKSGVNIKEKDRGMVKNDDNR